TVRVPELPRCTRPNLLRPSRVSDPRLAVAGRHELDASTVRIEEMKAPVELKCLDARRLQGDPRLIEAAATGKLQSRMQMPGLALDELERVRLVLAGEESPPGASAAVEQPELRLPARPRLVEVVDREADVVDPREPDHARAASSAASSSGTASATWIVSAVTSGSAPGPVSSSSDS